MPVISGSVLVNAPAARVYDLVCTPTNWPQWYPITKSVTIEDGDPSRPAGPGTVALERVVVWGMEADFRWTFLEADPPKRLHYEGTDIKRGGHAAITYTFAPEGDGTRFSRVLTYEAGNWFMRLLDFLVIRHLFKRASDQALESVRKHLSGG